MSRAGLRLFYALWPDEATRAALQTWQAQLPDGRAVVPANLHLTLVFLGQQPAAALPSLQALPSRYADFDCALTLDRLGCFRRQGVVWAGMRETPPAMDGLQRALRQAVVEQGVAVPEEHGAFVPHVTLVRNAATLPDMEREGKRPPIVWRARRVVLAESVVQPGGAVYRVLASS